MLNRDATAERRDAIHVALRDGFRVVDEPVQALKRDFPIHFFIDVQRPRDRLVVSGVEAEGPAILRQQAHHGLQLLLHDAGHVGARFEKVLEIRGREDQHLSSAIVAKIIVALPWVEHTGPVLEVGELALGLLRE